MTGEALDGMAEQARRVALIVGAAGIEQQMAMTRLLEEAPIGSALILRVSGNGEIERIEPEAFYADPEAIKQVTASIEIGGERYGRFMDEIDSPKLMGVSVLESLFASSVGGREQRYRDRLGFMHKRHPAQRHDRGSLIRQIFDGLEGDVTHIDTPKPVSKRKARRLRGKGRA